MVADSQVVLQAEGLQYHAVPHREGQPQLLAGGRPCETPPSGKPTPSPSGPSHTPGMPPPTAQGSTLHEAQPPPRGRPPPGNRRPTKEAPPTQSGSISGGHPTLTTMKEAHPTEDCSRSLQETTPYPSSPKPDGPTLKAEASHQTTTPEKPPEATPLHQAPPITQAPTPASISPEHWQRPRPLP